MRSLPSRETRTGFGIFPVRKPGIFTLCERSDIAWSTACLTWSDGPSTVKRMRFSPTVSTAVTGPFNQPALGSGPMERYDVVVVGVGGMGSAALYHLARRGKRALGLERFDLLHEHGSSHGLTRIIRLAYFEHPDYVPLLKRAYELWRELEAEADEQLLHVTGIVEGGDRILDGVLRSCAEHDIRHEVLNGAEIAERFPAYRLPPTMDVVHQPDGGFVVPERSIVAHVQGALSHGATLRARERVLEWEQNENGVRVTTDRGVVEAETLVLTAGAWSQDVA